MTIYQDLLDENSIIIEKKNRKGILYYLRTSTYNKRKERLRKSFVKALFDSGRYIKINDEFMLKIERIKIWPNYCTVKINPNDSFFKNNLEYLRNIEEELCRINISTTLYSKDILNLLEKINNIHNEK